MADKLSFFEKSRRFDAVIQERDAAIAQSAALDAKLKELQSATAQAAELESGLSEATSKISALELNVKNLTETNAAMAEALNKAKDEKVAADNSTDAKASVIAAQKLAEVGVAPVSVAAGIKPGGESVVMSRASFNQLTPSDRMKFIKSGGKITE